MQKDETPTSRSSTMQCPHCLGSYIEVSRDVLVNGGVIKCKKCGMKTKFRSKLIVVKSKNTKKLHPSRSSLDFIMF